MLEETTPDNEMTQPPAPARASASPKSSETGKLWGFTKELLVIAVLPLVGWVIKLEVGNAERDMKIEQLAEDQIRLEERIEESEAISVEVRNNALQLVRLEGKIDTANGRLDDIKSLLNK
jgi:hypothetical protein